MAPFQSLESDLKSLKSATESICRQLGAWIRSIKDSELKGQRYVKEKTWQQATRVREREEFLKELEANRKAGASQSGPPKSEIQNSKS